MQFQVPQFIEIEDKIIGPLTLKQFIYLAGAGGFAFILFFILQFWLWIIAVSVLGILAASLAFIKYNSRPLISILFSAARYAWNPKFYLWKRVDSGVTTPTLPSIKIERQKVQPLKNLWLQMNANKEAVEKREKQFTSFNFFKKPKEVMEKYEVIRKTEGDRELYNRVDYR